MIGRVAGDAGDVAHRPSLGLLHDNAADTGHLGGVADDKAGAAQSRQDGTANHQGVAHLVEVFVLAHQIAEAQSGHTATGRHIEQSAGGAVIGEASVVHLHSEATSQANNPCLAPRFHGRANTSRALLDAGQRLTEHGRRAMNEAPFGCRAQHTASGIKRVQGKRAKRCRVLHRRDQSVGERAREAHRIGEADVRALLDLLTATIKSSDAKVGSV